MRLRQAVLLARELEPVAALLRAELGLGEPFRDPGVGEFGLANVVFAIGDCFLEVVSPLREGTAAARQLERAGSDCGYMALFDLEDLDSARRRLAQSACGSSGRSTYPISRAPTCTRPTCPERLSHSIVRRPTGRGAGEGRNGPAGGARERRDV